MFKAMLSEPDFKPVRGDKRGFTLIEMLVAVALTSLVMIFMWNLFISGSKSIAYGTWYSGSIQQLRRGLTMLRQDIAKATYPSKIEPRNITITETPDFYFGYKDLPAAAPLQLTAGGGTTQILHFWICRPDNTVPGTVNDEDRIECTLEARGTKLHYTRRRTVGNVDETGEDAEELNKDIIEDVKSISLVLTRQNATDADGSQAKGDSTGVLTLTVRTVHPIEKAKGAEETTTAKLNIRYKPI